MAVAVLGNGSGAFGVSPAAVGSWTRRSWRERGWCVLVVRWLHRRGSGRKQVARARPCAWRALHAIGGRQHQKALLPAMEAPQAGSCQAAAALYAGLQLSSWQRGTQVQGYSWPVRCKARLLEETWRVKHCLFQTCDPVPAVRGGYSRESTR
jgi:hypothetical protein